MSQTQPTPTTKTPDKTAKSKKHHKEKPAIIREFNEFINRGNVVDLAVGVIIGGAFSSIVTSLVNDIIMPLIGVVMGGVNFKNLEITIPNFFGSADAAHIKYGSFLQNIVDFLIVAFCIFLFVRFINKIATKNKAMSDAENAKTAEAVEASTASQKSSDDEILAVLKDIRSELKKQK